MRQDILKFVTNCEECQKWKQWQSKIRKSPPKTVDTNPWNNLRRLHPDRGKLKRCYNYRSSYKLLGHSLPTSVLHHSQPQFDNEWLCHPRPSFCIHDRGTEFMGKEFQERIKLRISQAITTEIHKRIPSSNAFILQWKYLTNFNHPSRNKGWRQILQSVSWALKTTWHQMLRASPGQVVLVAVWFW
jgi:hypothetical protein